MTPIAKDLENAVTPSAPGQASTGNSSAGTPARPQPVALEVPVTVNGARTVDGSEKREPFSEKSATVLVFGHGAVIRLAASLAPGQLVFLTNEKSRKEVVCQVVKSKSDGNAVGYVELRFTEPAPGFWGMRFPSDTVLPQAASRPAAPSSAPVPAKAAVPAVPVVRPPAALDPVVPAKPVAPAASSPVSPVSQIAPSPAISEISARVPVSAPPAPEPKILFPTPVPPPSFASPEVATRQAPIASAPPAVVAESKPAVPISSAPAASGTSTEELKQQAARLQEQLSSLLFTESAKPMPQVPTTETESAPEIAPKAVDHSTASPEQVPSAPAKTPLPVAKSHVASLEVEEIKIPSWLAPLARETDTPTPSTKVNSFHVDGTNSDVESVIPQTPNELVLSEAQDSSRRPEAAVFGGQLLGETSHSVARPASKSKMGLFIGIAATLLLVAGGAWYSRQPGNAISAMLSGDSASSKQPVSSRPAENPSVESAPARAAASGRSPEPARVNPPVEPAPIPSALVERASRNSNPAASATHVVQPEPEEPKKPSLGDVRLAAPVVNHDEEGSSGSASAPSLELNQPVSSSNPIPSLAGAHRAGPVAPTPVGGEVRPAKLIKSVAPDYPVVARTQHVSGDVQIDALIDAEGNVGAMKVLSGSPLLHQAALNALKQWKYQPAELDGKPTSMHLTVTIQFRVQ